LLIADCGFPIRRIALSYCLLLTERIVQRGLMNLSIAATSLPSPHVANNRQSCVIGRSRRIVLPSRNVNDPNRRLLAGFQWLPTIV
jgi:hypothetical protein